MYDYNGWAREPAYSLRGSSHLAVSECSRTQSLRFASTAGG